MSDAALRAVAAIATEAVWVRPATAAQMLDLSPEAFRCRIRRSDLPEGIVRKWGRSVLIHKERLLKWLEEPPVERDGR
jgi:hypothetical protein